MACWGRNFILCVLFLGSLRIYVNGSKYSEKANKPNTEKSRAKEPFRMSKLNLLWEKAQKKLDKGRLSELYAELMVQDRLELDAKHRSQAGEDEDGSNMAAVRTKFLALTKKFDLMNTKDNLIHENEYKKKMRSDNRGILERPGRLKQERDMDSRLASLYDRAKRSGFTDEELNDLEEEFKHHQDKLDQFDNLRNEINQYHPDDNTLERLKEETLSPEELRKKREEMKKLHREIKDDMENLKKKVSDPASVASGIDLEFTEPKVIQLWQLAKKGNFSESELRSLKEELHHFEHKVRKHEILKKEATLAVAGTKNLSPDRQKHMQEKADDYEKRIKKHHSELKYRITTAQKHNEL